MDKTKQILEKDTTKKNANLRHYVELDGNEQPTDKALCGYIWDRLHVQHNGNICQECVDEMRKRS